MNQHFENSGKDSPDEVIAKKSIEGFIVTESGQKIDATLVIEARQSSVNASVGSTAKFRKRYDEIFKNQQN